MTGNFTNHIGDMINVSNQIPGPIKSQVESGRFVTVDRKPLMNMETGNRWSETVGSMILSEIVVNSISQ